MKCLATRPGRAVHAAALVFIISLVAASAALLAAEPPEPLAVSSAIYYEVADGVESDAETGQIRTRGQTRLWGDGFHIASSDVTIDPVRGWLSSPGVSVLTLGDIELRGAELWYSFEDEAATLGRWSGNAGPYRLAGAELNWARSELEFKDGWITTCSGPNPAMAVTARRCKLTLGRRIVFSGMSLRFFGRRILYLPRLTLRLPDEHGIGVGEPGAEPVGGPVVESTALSGGYSRRLGLELGVKHVHPVSPHALVVSRIDYFSKIGPLFSESARLVRGPWEARFTGGRMKLRDEFFEPYIVSMKPGAALDWRGSDRGLGLGLRIDAGRYYERESGADHKKLDALSFARGPAPLCSILGLDSDRCSSTAELRVRYADYSGADMYRILTGRVAASRRFSRDQGLTLGLTLKAGSGSSPFGFDREDTETRADMELRLLIKQGWFFVFDGEMYLKNWREKRAHWTVVRDWDCFKLSLTWDNTNGSFRAGGEIFGFSF